jgi:hypothetical protein
MPDAKIIEGLEHKFNSLVGLVEAVDALVETKKERKRGQASFWDGATCLKMRPDPVSFSSASGAEGTRHLSMLIARGRMPMNLRVLS